MNATLPAQAVAQLISLVVFASAARWYLLPRLKSLTRARALATLLWVHVFRYVALQIFSAQRDGFPISAVGAREIVIGDVVGAAIAFITIILLRRGSRLSIPLAWILVAETAYDTFANIRGGIHDNLMGAASGVTWMILTYFVPMVIVTAVLIAVQLVSRRNEELEDARAINSSDAA